MEINEDECQCILFQCSEIDELRQPLTPFGKVAVADLPVRDVRGATSVKQSTLFTHHRSCLPEYGQELNEHFKF